MSDDTERQLGILMGKVDALNARLDRADEGRAATHRRIDNVIEDIHDMSTKIDAVGTQVNTVATDVAQMKPDIATVRTLKGNAAFAVFAVGSFTALVAWLFNTFWEPLKTLFGKH